MATAKTEKIYIQVDDEVREATTEEAEQIKAEQIAVAEHLAAVEAKLAARASALAKLAELGLTKEEIAAL